MMYWEIVGGLKDEEPLLDSILTHMGNMYEKLEKVLRCPLVCMEELSKLLRRLQ
ncbi:hypothetical protein HAX54_017246, partial [Datura stramonium]|nr:hypothetical protein [Datura stramonium]